MSDCAFCTELNTRICEPFGGDRVIWEDDDFMILPTVGCFVEGYVMIMPKDHTFSIAQLDDRQLRKLGHLSCQLRGQLQRIYGIMVEAEHGAVSCDIKGAQCCDHAHLHFIPVITQEKLDKMCREYAGAAEFSGNKPDLVTTLMDMGKYSGYAYILFSAGPGIYNVWKSSDGFERQFCRRAAAIAHDIERLYNWKEHFGVENMHKTYDRLKGKLRFENLDY